VSKPRLNRSFVTALTIVVAGAGSAGTVCISPVATEDASAAARFG
jgi:hypothetical protein